jgi:hypothetical protein
VAAAVQEIFDSFRNLLPFRIRDQIVFVRRRPMFDSGKVDQSIWFPFQHINLQLQAPALVTILVAVSAQANQATSIIDS